MYIFWVDASKGSDNIGLGTKTEPFLTLEKALQCSQAGDAIFLVQSSCHLNTVKNHYGLNGVITISGEDSTLYISNDTKIDLGLQVHIESVTIVMNTTKDFSDKIKIMDNCLVF